MRVVDEDDRWDGLNRWTKILKVTAILLFATFVGLLFYIFSNR